MNAVNQLAPTLLLAERVCKKAGARLTAKRQQVLTILLQSNKAVSAYELIEKFSEYYDEKLIPMTAYRTLEFLESVHLAHRLNIANKYVACSFIGGDCKHELPHFLICQKCLKVDELNSQTPNTLHEITANVEETGYQLLSPQIELNCICSACQSSTNID